MSDSCKKDCDEVLHCTGVVTEYEINELKERIASGMTTADDVDLLDKVIKYGYSSTKMGSGCSA